MVKRLFLIVLLLGTSSCHKSPALDQLLQRVDALEQAIETRHNDDAIDILSDDFKAGNGQNRKDARRMLLFYSLRNANIHILRTNTEAELDPTYQNQASVTCQVLVPGGQGLLPERGRSFRISSRWVFQDGDWYLDRLDWKPLL